MTTMETRVKSAKSPATRRQPRDAEPRFKKYSMVRLARRPLALELHVHSFHGDQAILLLCWEGRATMDTEPFGPFLSLEIKMGFEESDRFFQSLAVAVGYEVEGYEQYARNPVRAHRFPGDSSIYVVGHQGCMVSSKLGHARAVSLCREIAPALGWRLEPH